MNQIKILLCVFVTIVVSTVTSLADEEATDSKIVGHWVFMYKGQKRAYAFNGDKTFEGSYPVSGKHFLGTWKMERSMVILIRGGVTKNFGIVTLKPDGEAEYLAEGYRMIGQKAEH